MKKLVFWIALAINFNVMPGNNMARGDEKLCKKVQRALSNKKYVFRGSLSGCAAGMEGGNKVVLIDQSSNWKKLPRKVKQFLIGHEIAHHDLGHTKSSFKPTMIHLGCVLLSCLGYANGSLRIALLSMLVSGATSWISRQQERQADLFSAKHLNLAKEGAGYFVESKAKKWTITVFLEKLFTIFLSHPTDKERACYLGELAKEMEKDS